MRTSMRTIIILCFALLPLGIVAKSVEGALITSVDVDVTQDPTGDYNYVYTLVNDVSSDSIIAAFGVNVKDDANLSNLFAPIGWNTVYAAGDPAIAWDSSPIAFIAPGESAIFGFSSALGPSSQDYAVLGFDPNTFDISINQGQTFGPGVSPQAIPEPSTLTIFGLGLLGLAIFGKNKTRKKELPRTCPI